MISAPFGATWPHHIRGSLKRIHNRKTLVCRSWRKRTNEIIKVTKQEAAVRVENQEAGEKIARLADELEIAMKAKGDAYELIAEYEGGAQKRSASLALWEFLRPRWREVCMQFRALCRLRKLEAENHAKSSRIAVLDEALAEREREINDLKLQVKKATEDSRTHVLNLSASLELKVHNNSINCMRSVAILVG
jgi:hypothetical protein